MTQRFHCHFPFCFFFMFFIYFGSVIWKNKHFFRLRCGHNLLHLSSALSISTELKINTKYPHTQNHFNRALYGWAQKMNVMNLIAVSFNINDCSIALHLLACFVLMALTKSWNCTRIDPLEIETHSRFL